MFKINNYFSVICGNRNLSMDTYSEDVILEFSGYVF